MTDPARPPNPRAANAVSSPALLPKKCAGDACETPARRATSRSESELTAVSRRAASTASSSARATSRSAMVTFCQPSVHLTVSSGRAQTTPMDSGEIQRAYQPFVGTLRSGGFGQPPAGWDAALIAMHVAANNDLIASV